jgi:membrane carboxypeptidase/penicillin-binding protein PbpC
MKQTDKHHNRQKQVLKTLIAKSHTKEEAIKLLNGDEGKPMKLKLIIGGRDPQKWFLNDEPVSQQQFNKLFLESKGPVTVSSNGKVFGSSKTVLDDNDKT